MNTYRWILLGGATLILSAACVVTSGTDEDDGSGNGGSGNTTTTGGSGGTGGGSGGGATCDTGDAGDIVNGVADAVCGDCLTCASDPAGACATEFAPCAENTGEPCDLYRTCVSDCEISADTNNDGMYDTTEQAALDACLGDPSNPMTGTCVGDQAAGYDEFAVALSCAVCDQCTNNCNAAANCTTL